MLGPFLLRGSRVEAGGGVKEREICYMINY